MREVEPGGDAKSGATASDGSRLSEPPPSSTRGFIGTNIDAVQAYVPPTTLPETPEPPVPDTKVALSEGVDPRKLPTMPNLKRAAKSLAAELRGEVPAPVKAEVKPELQPAISPEKKRPAPVVEAPPDSQISSIRRGAGYAPSRGHSPSVAPAAATRVADPIPRATPAKGIGIKPSVRPPPPAEPAETPTQRRAALLFIFLFAALLAVAVYFFLRRAPSPPTDAPAPPSSAPAPSATTPSAISPLPAPSPAPSSSADLASSSTVSAVPSVPSAPTVAAVRTGASSDTAEAAAATATAAPAPTAVSTGTAAAPPAASGPEGTRRWF